MFILLPLKITHIHHTLYLLYIPHNYQKNDKHFAEQHRLVFILKAYCTVCEVRIKSLFTTSWNVYWNEIEIISFVYPMFISFPLSFSLLCSSPPQTLNEITSLSTRRHSFDKGPLKRSTNQIKITDKMSSCSPYLRQVVAGTHSETDRHVSWYTAGLYNSENNMGQIRNPK